MPTTGLVAAIQDDTTTAVRVVESGQQSTISVSDALAARIDDLQFALGEGPHWDALRHGSPVLVPNFLAVGGEVWPMLTSAITEFGVGALFAFPLRTGAVTIGVVDLYRSTVEPLSEREVTEAVALARDIAPRALQFAITLANDETPPTNGLAVEMRREIHQATGMILVQLNIDATEAFARLRAHAFGSGLTIQEVAKDVVQRRLNFRDLPE